MAETVNEMTCHHEVPICTPYDFGIDPETGYHDAGTKFECADCREPLDEWELPNRAAGGCGAAASEESEEGCVKQRVKCSDQLTNLTGRFFRVGLSHRQAMELAVEAQRSLRETGRFALEVPGGWLIG